jgi:hypothetical protein
MWSEDRMKKYILNALLVLGMVLGISSLSIGALTSWDTLSSSDPSAVRKVLNSAMLVKGDSDTNFYFLEVDPTTGAIPVAPYPESGRDVVEAVRNDYSSTNVTTGAWVELVASLSGDVNLINVADTCGEVLEIGTGAAASESRLLVLPPGGYEGNIPVSIASGTRVALRALSGNCTTGDHIANFLD